MNSGPQLLSARFLKKPWGIVLKEQENSCHLEYQWSEDDREIEILRIITQKF